MLKDSRVLVVGGAGFVGSHLVDQLAGEPVREIVVLDNFVRGTRPNLSTALMDNRVRLVEGSVTNRDLLRELMDGTGQSVQIIDGQFTGVDEQGDAWVVIRAVDSSWWEVWSDNQWVHDAIRAHFRVVESIPVGAG